MTKPENWNKHPSRDIWELQVGRYRARVADAWTGRRAERAWSVILCPDHYPRWVNLACDEGVELVSGVSWEDVFNVQHRTAAFLEFFRHHEIDEASIHTQDFHPYYGPTSLPWPRTNVEKQVIDVWIKRRLLRQKLFTCT